MTMTPEQELEFLRGERSSLSGLLEDAQAAAVKNAIDRTRDKTESSDLPIPPPTFHESIVVLVEKIAVCDEMIKEATGRLAASLDEQREAVVPQVDKIDAQYVEP